jgi:glucose 1-dehydrogenase
MDYGAKRFAGQVAIVTGASSGIGAATASRLSAEGALVVLADVDEAPGARLAAELGGGCRFVRCDVSVADDWQRVLRAAQDLGGGVDVLVSNAYTVVVAPAHHTSAQQWGRQIDVCLTGAFLGAHACLSSLVERGGSIVLTSSVHALVGLPGHPAYAAAKGGLTALARQLAVEYGPRVRVNSVLPGPVMTPAWDRVPDNERQQSIEQTVARRFGEPHEVAAVIAFLASGEASYVTGASIVVDGGWSIFKTSA